MDSHTFFFLTLLSITINYSRATYCVCNQGLNDTVLQKNIDYACGAGADCSAILLNGNCYQPNTVKAHCDYAVNYYYQKMNQVTGSCSFSGTASTISTPTNLVSGCTYPASPSAIGSSTPSSTAVTPTASTSTTTSPTTSTTGTTTFPIVPTGSFASIGSTIQIKSVYVRLITLVFTGRLALWC